MNKNFVEDNYQLIKSISGYEGSALTQQDREDLINDTVIRILESDTEIRQEQASAYIHRVMSNIIKNRMRDASTDIMGHITDSLDQPLDADAEERDLVLHDVMPGHYIEDTDAIEIRETEHYSQMYKSDIEELCSFLPPKQARLFSMRYYLGMTPEEIGEALSIENNSVRTSLKRAVKNAFKLTSTQAADNRKYDGLTIREMAMGELTEDSVYFPFLLYYTKTKNLMNVCRMTGRSVHSVKTAISIGEKMLYVRYGFDIKNRIVQ